jgi:hypothetical protein
MLKSIKNASNRLIKLLRNFSDSTKPSYLSDKKDYIHQLNEVVDSPLYHISNIAMNIAKDYNRTNDLLISVEETNRLRFAKTTF